MSTSFLHTDLVWYAIYTKPRWEKKVAALLSARNITNYCPLNKKIKQWHDRKKIVFEPLFQSYVFVQVTEVEKWQVQQVEGILNYVYWLGKPARIKDEEIALIRNFLSDHIDVSIQKQEIRLMQEVKIIQGPFINQSGHVYEMHGNRVKVAINSLGVMLTANFSISAIAPCPI